MFPPVKLILMITILTQDVELQIMPVPMPPIIQCIDDRGYIYEVDEPVLTDDPCMICHCNQTGKIYCTPKPCPGCRGKVVPVQGQCCGECYIGDILIKPGIGCAKCGETYNFGDIIHTDDPCEICFCQDDVDVLCHMIDCDEHQCRGVVKPVNGTCCGDCVPGCKHDGIIYNVGDYADTGDPCEICICERSGEPMECVHADCYQCEPAWKYEPIEGQCCGKCMFRNITLIHGNGCLKDEIIYPFGDVIPTEDPCETCFCEEYADDLCHMILCDECRGIHKPVNGTCCGECTPGCEHNGTIYQVGDDVDTGNPCELCTCARSGEPLICAIIDCFRCGSGWNYEHIEGKCCGKCTSGNVTLIPGHGCLKNGIIYPFGNVIPTADPCETCFCEETGVLCQMIACAECIGIHKPVNGTCCGECLPACKHNGTIYQIGDDVDTGNPCEICKCERPGPLLCAIIDCPPCGPGSKYVQVEGQCCGKCMFGNITVVPGYGCLKDGILYPFGERMKSSDPCEFCSCTKTGDILCAWTDCHCSGTYVPVNGSCCGDCHVCNFSGATYKVGPFIDPNDKCNSCECLENGTVICEPIKCPRKPPCRRRWRVRLDDQCCQVCKCRYKRRTYMPGPFGKRCDGCVCGNDGKVTCQKPHCPNVTLMCADPAIGDDCCPYCPNGVTCMASRKTIIKAGEYKKVGRKVCHCAGLPWFTNAFCASLKIDRKLKRTYGKWLANFPFPGI